jgi:hypothetical protein
LVAPVPASVGVEEDLQALTHVMSFTEHYGWHTRLHAI